MMASWIRNSFRRSLGKHDGMEEVRALCERESSLNTGMKLLAFGKSLLVEEECTDRQPTLEPNEDQRLRFAAFDGQTLDCIPTPSVFNPLPKGQIDGCFEHVGNVMTAENRFSFAFLDDEDHRRRSVKDLSQPSSSCEELVERHGYMIDNLAARYRHPSGRKMACATFA